jgi:hypothetical protein
VICTGTLDVVSPWNVGSTSGDGINLLGQDFAAARPGCSAQVLFVGAVNTAIMEKLVAAVAGGDPPPVTLVPAQQTPLWTSKGVVQPLDPYARRDKISKGLFLEGYWPQMEIRGKLWRQAVQHRRQLPLVPQQEPVPRRGAQPGTDAGHHQGAGRRAGARAQVSTLPARLRPASGRGRARKGRGRVRAEQEQSSA